MDKFDKLFYVWFAFVATIIVVVLCGVGYVAIRVMSYFGI